MSWDPVHQKQMATEVHWDCISQTLNLLGQARNKAVVHISQQQGEQVKIPSMTLWQTRILSGHASASFLFGQQSTDTKVTEFS